MNLKDHVLCLCAVCLLLTIQAFARTRLDDVQYVGQFETGLVADKENTERVIFKTGNLKGGKGFGETAHVTTNRFVNPTNKSSLTAVLVEEVDVNPLLFVDLNADNSFGDDEKFAFRQEAKDNPYLWITTVNVPFKNGFFTSCQMFVRFYKEIQTAKMTDSDRLLEQSTAGFARGTVDVKGRKVLVQYAYDFESKKINPSLGWQGVDADENGEIDMDNLSPEAADANNETIVFRVGQTYLSTKKVSVEKNQIVLRENQAKDYKRTELGIGKELPDFSFVDLNGKKRKFSEFRGKYVLLDFWGLWCPACRVEIPYMKEAYKRFQGRGLEIVGMNTDKFTPQSIKKTLDENGLVWTQARLDSFVEFAGEQLRIQSFPTTFLIAPDGKILSMSRQERGEPDLRGKDLLTTLDEILPEK